MWLLIVLMIADNLSAKNIFDHFSLKKADVVPSPSQIKLIKEFELESYLDKNGDRNFLSLQLPVIDYKNNLLLCFSRKENRFYKFDFKAFKQDAKAVYEVEKYKGHGPNDIQFPMDMILHKGKLYISDITGWCIYEYDLNFNELRRFNMNKFRPFRLSAYGDYLFITPYVRQIEPGLVAKIDLVDDSKVEYIINPSSEYSDKLENRASNELIYDAVNDSTFFSIRKYPDYAVYFGTHKYIFRKFCSPKLEKSKLPKPETKVFIENGKPDKKYYGVPSYQDLHYSKEKGLVFTLTFKCWPELMEANNLHLYITIYDTKGRYLCEQNIQQDFTDGLGEISKLCYDYTNNALFVFGLNKVVKYKIVETK